MAPAVPRKSNRGAVAPNGPKHAMATGPMPPEVAEALEKLAKAQANALKRSK